ncbi:Glycosyl hydrolase family 63, C-terminal [Dillenia turbinata]|uniref:Glycosyl hydrolase family 63, C-terminal n=1 Tax=Dillenia turbinata TaxID=194707 RepID=A0AAN8WBL2_9MAGN
MVLTKLGLQLPDTSDDLSNVSAFQISDRIPLTTNFAFVYGSDLNSRIDKCVSNLTVILSISQCFGSIYEYCETSEKHSTRRLNEKEREIDEKLQRCFNLNDKVDSVSLIVGKAAIGNLLGGIGYLCGQSKISHPGKPNLRSSADFLSYCPAELCTAVLGRPFFPMGRRFLPAAYLILGAEELRFQRNLFFSTRQMGFHPVCFWLSEVSWPPNQFEVPMFDNILADTVYSHLADEGMSRLLKYLRNNKYRLRANDKGKPGPLCPRAFYAAKIGHYPLAWMLIPVLHIQVKKNVTWIFDVGCFLERIAWIPS